MKTILFFLFSLVICSDSFGQSVKKQHKLLLAECASEQFDSTKLAARDKTGFLERGERRILDLFMTTSGLTYELKQLEAEPLPTALEDLRNRKLTSPQQFTKPIKETVKTMYVFEKVSEKVYLDGFKMKEQNEVLNKKIREYRHYASANAIRQEEMESTRDKLLAFLPRMDSLLEVYEVLSDELMKTNFQLQKKLNELEANFRKKGPEGFSYAYHRVFPELFPDYFPPMEGSFGVRNGPLGNIEEMFEGSPAEAIEEKE